MGVTAPSWGRTNRPYVSAWVALCVEGGGGAVCVQGRAGRGRGGGGGAGQRLNEYAGWYFQVYIHVRLFRREASTHGRWGGGEGTRPLLLKDFPVHCHSPRPVSFSQTPA